MSFDKKPYVILRFHCFNEKQGIFFENEKKIKEIFYLKNGIKERTFYFLIDTPYYKLLKKLDNNYLSKFVFVGKNFKIIYELTERELLDSLKLL